jgi:hypothetical protein
MLKKGEKSYKKVKKVKIKKKLMLKSLKFHDSWPFLIKVCVIAKKKNDHL